MWGDISLWFWFAFPLWLVMLSIFSYVGWPSVCLFVFFKILFIYLRASTSGGEGQKAREKQTSCWAGSPMWGLIPGPWYHVLSWRQTLNWPNHPGALICLLWRNVCSCLLPILNWIIWGGVVLSCISALYILDTKPLLNMSLANIFSHSVSCLLALLVVSFTMQKLFILM